MENTSLHVYDGVHYFWYLVYLRGAKRIVLTPDRFKLVFKYVGDFFQACLLIITTISFLEDENTF